MLRTFFMVVLSLLTSQLGLLSAFAQENKSTIKEAIAQSDIQMSFFQLNDPVLEQIHEQLISIDINTRESN